MYVSVGSIRKRCNCLENDWRYNSEMNKKIFWYFFCCFLFYPPFCVLSILLSEVSPLRYTTISIPFHPIPIVLPCPLVLDFRWCCSVLCYAMCWFIWELYVCSVQHSTVAVPVFCAFIILGFSWTTMTTTTSQAAAAALATPESQSSSRAHQPSNQPPSNERANERTDDDEVWGKNMCCVVEPCIA